MESAEFDLQQALNKFGITIYNLLRKSSGNIAFSQMSAHSILTLLQQAAGGSFRETLDGILGTENPESFIKIYEEKVCKIRGMGISKDHAAVLKNIWDEIERSENMESYEKLNSISAAEKINKWVNEKTSGLIDNIIDSSILTPDTNLILINALHFKDIWCHEFQKENTRTEPFYPDSDNQIDVQMMHLHRKDFFYLEDELLDAKMISLPYFKAETAMLFILPKDKKGIGRLEENLPKVDLPKLFHELCQNECHIAIPKFKIQQEIVLEDILKKMGLEELFIPGKCNLSQMLEDFQNVAVDRVAQKTVIDVNEEGTEAASSCSLRYRKFSSWKYPKVCYFFADHPFIFMIIYQNNGLVFPLFMGRVSHPEYPVEEMAPRGIPLVEGFADRDESD